MAKPVSRAAAPAGEAVREFEGGAGRMRIVPEIVAIVVMGTVLFFIHAEFAARVDPRLLLPWLAFMGACMVARVATLRLSSSPRTRARLPRSAWVRTGQAITMGFCLGIVASVWILMPAADERLQLLMILLCMWFIAMVIILNADRLSVLGALMVVCSMAAFAVIRGLPYAFPLAGFLVMEGAALVMIRRTISRSAEALRSALALVQAERDAKTRFLASASHDLQQPLQAARLYFEQALAAEAGERREHAIEGARSAFESTGTLVDSMLEHLRLEADAMPVRPAPLALHDLLGSVAREHAPSARAAAIQISTFGPPGELTSDARLLRRILCNLLANAVRHSGGSRVLLGTRRRGSAIEIWAIDNGRGVPASDAERLFEDYYQGGNTAVVGGLGLGLASARRMAVLLGGDLAYEPRWTRGAAFVLRLPGGVERKAA